MGLYTQLRPSVSITLAVLALVNFYGQSDARILFELDHDFRPQIDPYFAPVSFNHRNHEAAAINIAMNDVYQDTAGYFSKEEATFVCPKNFGHFVDPDDCTSYFYCKFWIPRKEKCPQKKIFSESLKKCRNGNKANCGGNNDKDKHGFKCPVNHHGIFPNPEDCSEYFKCQFKKQELIKCDKNKLYDIKKKECMNKTKVTCRSRFNPYEKTTTVQPETPTKMTKSSITPTSLLETTTETLITSTRTSSPPTSPDTDITSSSIINDGSSSHNLASSTDTTLCPDERCSTISESNDESTSSSLTTNTSTSEHITGSTEVTSAENTPESTMSSFSTNDQTMESSTITANTESNGSDSSRSTGSTLEISSTTDLVVKFVCPKIRGNFPVENDCSKYYTCKKSVPTVKECDEDTLFHATYGFCYDANLVDCGARKRPDKYSTTRTSTSLDKSTSTSETSSSDLSTESTETTYSNSPSESSLRIIISTESSTTSTSEETSTNNEEITLSESSTNSIASDDSDFHSSTASTTESTSEQSGSDLTTFPSSPSSIRVSGDNKHVISTTTTESATCQADDESCIVDETGLLLKCSKDEDLFAHPTDNTRFIQCVHGKIYVHKCPHDLVFDEKQKICDWS